MTTEFGVVMGRFQPPHLGHMEYLLAAEERSDHLLIGLTNPDPSLTEDHPADPERSTSRANPFTYFERFRMVERAMNQHGVESTEFDVIPFPINKPELLEHYIPAEATYYITIYDSWGETKRELLEEYCGPVEIIYERDDSERPTSGTEVREFMATGKAWQGLVPRSVAKYISERELDERVAERFENENER